MRRGAGRNSWEWVYPQTEVLPQIPGGQPPLSRSRNTRTNVDSHEATQAPTPVFSTLYLIKVPKGLAPDPAWYTTLAELGSHQARLLVGSFPHFRGGLSIESSFTFEGHILQSCGADIHSVHSFLAGTRRLIFSAAAWDIHPSTCMGIDASIASPAFNLG